MRKKLDAKLLEEFNNVTSFPNLIYWVNNNQSFFKNGIPKKYLRKDFSIKITSFNAVKSKEIYNCRYFPRDGILNPNQDPSLPTSYPGWYGSLSLEVNGVHDGKQVIYDLFKQCGIGIDPNVSLLYLDKEIIGNFYMFDSDWPILSQKALINDLKEKPRLTFFYAGNKMYNLRLGEPSIWENA